MTDEKYVVCKCLSDCCCAFRTSPGIRAENLLLLDETDCHVEFFCDVAGLLVSDAVVVDVEAGVVDVVAGRSAKAAGKQTTTNVRQSKIGRIAGAKIAGEFSRQFWDFMALILVDPEPDCRRIKTQLLALCPGKARRNFSSCQVFHELLILRRFPNILRSKGETMFDLFSC